MDEFCVESCGYVLWTVFMGNVVDAQNGKQHADIWFPRAILW